MIHWKRRLVIIAMLGAVSLQGHAEQSSESELRELVLQDCGSCHGMTLKGGLGPGLRPSDLEDRSVAAVASIIRTGVPEAAMPPWKDLLSDEEIRWISEALKSGSLVNNDNSR